MNIEGQDKVALIDTGAGRCCMNEEQYQTLGSPPLESQDVGFQLRTASGTLMPGMGFLTCNLSIGGEMYKQQFIVCRQLTPGIILGRDFLSRNQLGITWGPEGTLQLRDEQDPSIQTAEEITNPTVCTVPLSLFADPERILRRLYVFAEEPCKSNTATSEPCSPVFKEAQPRPSTQKNIEEHSNLEYHVNNLNLYLYVFGLFII